MNWKFTKVKKIVSAIMPIFFIIALFIDNSNCIRHGTGFGCLGVPGIVIMIVIIFPVIFGLTYLIWSLIQKKEIVEIQKKGTDDNIKEAQQ
jgi:hypothetical protein